jgi:hypothetical protein
MVTRASLPVTLPGQRVKARHVHPGLDVETVAAVHVHYGCAAVRPRPIAKQPVHAVDQAVQRLPRQGTVCELSA